MHTDHSILSVERDSDSFINRIQFDEDGYRKYLERRKVPQDRIANLAIKITSNGISPLAQANFAPASRSQKQDTIRISPFRLSTDITQQNLVLLHESEHFIHSCHPKFQAYMKGRIAVFGSFALASGAYMGETTFQSIEHSFLHPNVFETGVAGVGAVVASLAGAFGGFMIAKGIDTINPEEVLAQRVAKREISNPGNDFLHISL
jgi:hypothetical protein